MAADDVEDDMQWLDNTQYPISDEEFDDNAAEHEFPELEMCFDLRLSERAGVAIDQEAVPQHHPEPRVRARGITRPVPLTKTQRKQHYLEGHANYHPGCPFCVRCRGLADRHERKRGEDDPEPGGEAELDEVPTVSFDFCFLMQKGQGKAIPTMVARDHKTCYTHAFACPGKSTKEEEYSDQIVQKCKMFAEMLGYKRVATKSDQETAMRALQQKVLKSVNCEMVLTNSKRYDSKSNGKIEEAIQEVEGHVRTLTLHTENRIGQMIPPGHPDHGRAGPQDMLYACVCMSGQIHKGGGVFRSDCAEMQGVCGDARIQRVAMKSDQETAMRALQQLVQKSVNCEMVLTNSKRYDSKSNGKIEMRSRRSRGM
jgi:hypothetical protein